MAEVAAAQANANQGGATGVDVAGMDVLGLTGSGSGLELSLLGTDLGNLNPGSVLDGVSNTVYSVSDITGLGDITRGALHDMDRLLDAIAPPASPVVDNAHTVAHHMPVIGHLFG